MEETGYPLSRQGREMVTPEQTGKGDGYPGTDKGERWVPQGRQG